MLVLRSAQIRRSGQVRRGSRRLPVRTLRRRWTVNWDTNTWVVEGAQRVVFGVYEKLTPCWAHAGNCSADDPYCAASYITSGHPCNKPGSGRLGLCPEHEKVVL